MRQIPHMPAQRSDDPRGLLTFEGLLPEPYQSAEDATAENDHRHRFRVRPATATERVLLEHLGYILPHELTTHVRFPSGTVRRRTWPAIEVQSPTAAMKG